MTQDLDEVEDPLVRTGDGVVLIVYGAAQGAVDFALGPLVQTQPELFTQTAPVIFPGAQGSLLAMLWLLYGMPLGTHRASCTRNMLKAPVTRDPSCGAAYSASCHISTVGRDTSGLVTS